MLEKIKRMQKEKGNLIVMDGLKEMILKEEKRLLKIKRTLDDRLIDVPEGTLRIFESNKQIQYVHCIQNRNGSGIKLSYIKKEDHTIADRLAQKSYDQKVQKIVCRRLKQFDKLAKEYEDNEIDNIYEQMHPNRKSLVEPVEKIWSQKVLEWKSTPYIGKEFGVGIPEIYTKKGERVRSKSEKILADTFCDLGIEYKYECPLKLNGYGIVYPDFTILRKRDGEEVYWEHDGRMDDPKYAEKAIRKINNYISNGLFPGDRLIVSFESSGVVIRDSVIKMMIDKYL